MLSNHLGNVLATISDKKIAVMSDAESFIPYFVSNYSLPIHKPETLISKFQSPNSSPAPMTERTALVTPTDVRYGFNGMEEEAELNSGVYNTKFRQYDSRLCEWLSVDPKAEKYPSHSGYSAFLRNPLSCIDSNGDTIVFVGYTEQEIADYQKMRSALSASKLFNYIYEALDKSPHTYVVTIDRNYAKGGSYFGKDKKVVVSSNSPLVLAQEIFHAFQEDLGVYSSKDHSSREAEGDIMTKYIANEMDAIVGGILLEMENGWGNGILNMNGDAFVNPTNDQVQSSEYDRMFYEACSSRSDYFKDKREQGEDFPIGYTLECSGQKPLAIKEVFMKIDELKE